MNERKVSFVNPRNVSFDTQPNMREGQFSNSQMENYSAPIRGSNVTNYDNYGNYSQNNWQNSANYNNFDMPQNNRNPNNHLQNINMSQPNMYNPNWTYDQYNSMRGNHQPRKSFLKRLNDIPKFNGESFQKLTDFIDTCETLYCSIENDSEEREFFDQMMLRLRGEARNVVTKLENLNWRSIRTALRSHFAYLSNKDILTRQLENLRQEKDESSTKCINQIRTISKRYDKKD